MRQLGFVCTFITIWLATVKPTCFLLQKKTLKNLKKTYETHRNYSAWMKDESQMIDCQQIGQNVNHSNEIFRPTLKIKKCRD